MGVNDALHCTCFIQPFTYLKSNLTGQFVTRCKNYFCYCHFRFWLTYCFLNLISWTFQGTLTICFFQAVFFIHRIASQKGHWGKFLDIVHILLNIAYKKDNLTWSLCSKYFFKVSLEHELKVHKSIAYSVRTFHYLSTIQVFSQRRHNDVEIRRWINTLYATYYIKLCLIEQGWCYHAEGLRTSESEVLSC